MIRLSQARRLPATRERDPGGGGEPQRRVHPATEVSRQQGSFPKARCAGMAWTGRSHHCELRDTRSRSSGSTSRTGRTAGDGVFATRSFPGYRWRLSRRRSGVGHSRSLSDGYRSLRGTGQSKFSPARRNCIAGCPHRWKRRQFPRSLRNTAACSTMTRQRCSRPTEQPIMPSTSRMAKSRRTDRSTTFPNANRESCASTCKKKSSVGELFAAQAQQGLRTSSFPKKIERSDSAWTIAR